jgi:hypothetical protein
MTQLSDGSLLFAGGVDDDGVVLADAWLFEPRTGSWSQTGSLSAPRIDPSLVALPGAEALAIGGLSPTTFFAVARVERYAEGSRSWRSAGQVVAGSP